jgi:F-type H+-transporting ATPase subunit gamma
MPSLKAIRRRITSVRSTQQITRALKLVSAARLRRAQEALQNAFPYSEALARLADALLMSERIGPAEGAQRVSLVAVIGSDRGLCGGYLINVIRAAQGVRARSASAGIDVRFFAVGKKTVEQFTHERAPMAGRRVELRPRLAAVGLASEIAMRMLADYRSGAIEEAGVVYSKFQSAMSQRPTYERLLPVTPPEERRADRMPTEYLVEPSREALVPIVLRSYVESAVFHALLEAEASEQAARMTAMDNATNSASDMIERYTTELNRARQAQITRELMDIVGGAEALRGTA